jgi:hypothetical protein
MVAEPSARGEKLFYIPKQGESLFRFAQLPHGFYDESSDDPKARLQS